MTTRYYLLDGEPERLVKTVGGLGYVWLNGEWKQSNYLRAKVSGQGGDCDFHEITAAQAKDYLAGERVTWTEEDFESGGATTE